MNSNEVVDLARQKIDAEILELQERIRSLCSSRNALAPLHSLPPEVVTQIFKWVQFLYTGLMGCNSSDPASLPKWIQVTHVSQHWRNIALDSKSLYSTIVSHNLEYSRGMVKHSGSVPLTLVDTESYNRKKMWQAPELQEFVLGILPRVRKVWLRNTVAKNFVFPHIQKLNIPLEELCTVDYEFSNLALFPTSLRRLSLDWCLLPSFGHLSHFPNLVELDLGSMYGSKKLHVTALLEILDAMPQLVSLSFGNVMRREEERPIKRESPIRARLQHFHDKAVGSWELLAKLIPWLSFEPRFTCILDQYYADFAGLSLAFDQIRRQFQSSSMVLSTAKVVWIQDSNDNNEILLFEREDEEPRFQSVVSRDRDDLASFDPWWNSIAMLPLGDVESLIVNIKTWDSDVVDWSPWHGLQSLRRLVIENEETSLKFLHYLIERSQAKAGHSSEENPPPFSSLRELSLYGVEFNRELKAKVVAAFTKRSKQHGIKLHKLSFCDGSISDDTIKQLSKVVDVVERRGEVKVAE